MSKSEKVPYREALMAALALEAKLAPACERTLIAGSIRRERPTIGDIELVVEPSYAPVTDMFGQEAGRRSLLDDALAGMPLAYTKNGERYKQFLWRGMQVDLFIATRETWGAVAAIRTGSAEFTRWLVTGRRHGGGCPSHLSVRDARVFGPEGLLDTSTEELFFAALEQPCVAPAERDEGRWRR